MANHLRRQIRERVATMLTGLSSTGSNVFQSHVYPLETADFPALCVYTQEEEIEVDELVEADIDVDIEDEDKQLDVDGDGAPSEEEEFGIGLEEFDETGRNIAYTSFKKVSQYILDAYDTLADAKDKEVYVDYLVTNLKLYFDKFEDELKDMVDEPTTSAYDKAKEQVGL